MAITQISDYAIGDVNFNSMMTSLDNTYKGKAEVTLSEYDTGAAPEVKVGSVFDNNGALFVVDTADIAPTGYSGIAVSTTFYLYFDSSATAFIYDTVAPTWNDEYQGWYNGNDRALFSMYKDSTGLLYMGKRRLEHLSLFKKYFISDSISYADLYDVLIEWVPTDLQTIDISGTLGGNKRIMSLYKVFSSNTIRIQGFTVSSTTTATISPSNITDTGTTTVSIEIREL